MLTIRRFPMTSDVVPRPADPDVEEPLEARVVRTELDQNDAGPVEALRAVHRVAKDHV